jgi:MFS family permease
LGIVRAILGFGIGGEYPLSATLAAEGATDPNTRGIIFIFLDFSLICSFHSIQCTSGRHMALVFSMQGFGYLLAPLVGNNIFLFL